MGMGVWNIHSIDKLPQQMNIVGQECTVGRLNHFAANLIFIHFCTLFEKQCKPFSVKQLS